MNQCQCLTAKGQQCSKKSLTNTDFCKIHQNCKNKIQTNLPIEKIPIEKIPVKKIPAKKIPAEKIPVEKIPLKLKTVKIPHEEIKKRSDNYGPLVQLIFSGYEGSGLETGDLSDNGSSDFSQFLAGAGVDPKSLDTTQRQAQIIINPYLEAYNKAGGPEMFDAFIEGLGYKDSGLASDVLNEILNRYKSSDNNEKIYESLLSEIGQTEDDFFEIHNFIRFIAGTGFDPQKYNKEITKKMLTIIVSLYKALQSPESDDAFIEGIKYNF